MGLPVPASHSTMRESGPRSAEAMTVLSSVVARQVIALQWPCSRACCRSWQS